MGLRDVPEKYGLRTRFLRDERKVIELLYDLLSVSPVFKDGRFDTEKTFSFHDLARFHNECRRLRPVVENLLRFEVTLEERAAVKQFHSVLRLIGLTSSNTGKSKIGGDTVYYYRLDAEELNRVREIAARRQGQRSWDWIYQYYGWTKEDDDE
jgi:hypothetical protein